MEDPLLSGMNKLGIDEVIQTSIAAVEVLWFKIDPSELLKLCNILGIKARKQHITTREIWEKFAQTTLTPHYHDKEGKGTNWFDSDARHYTLKEWSSITPIVRTGVFDSKIIITSMTPRKKRGYW